MIRKVAEFREINSNYIISRCKTDLIYNLIINNY